jgi:tubulin polyglutamylase TTLL9
MDDIFIKSLQSVQKTIINDKHCFELYGYDILLDSTLKPWLIEINASPALTASSQDDFELKFRLLDDTLTIVDMENRLTGREKRIGGFDLIWNDGPIYIDDSNNNEQPRLNSFLGCLNDRDEQLKKLYRQIALNKKASKMESIN